MTQRIIIIVVILALAAAGYYYFTQQPAIEKKVDISTKIQKKEFIITVTATGELKAKRSEKIQGPQGMRSARIFNTTITDMVAEGTVVEKGDYVASLDKTELAQKMDEEQTEIEKILTQLDQAKIDTALEMRGLRDQLVNLRFSMEEKKLEVEQSRFEPQMVIQQAELDLEKTERDYNQLLKKYELTREKSIAKISEINTQLKQNQMDLKRLQDLAKGFRITAPKKGMVIYRNDWDGKIGPGSRISTWDPVVAELPDLTDMISKTYVNEVDISRVKKGQDVSIKVDAFPDNVYGGTVIQVANIGEQLRGYDAKVFEVVVQLNEVDSILRPAMTTSNEIITDIIPDVLAIPFEALFTDSLNFVFKKGNGKIVKQEVITGLTNEDEVIVDFGLEEGDEVFLTKPEGADDLVFVPLDPAIKEEIRKKQEAAKKEREAKMVEKMKEAEKIQPPQGDDDDNGGGVRFFFN